MISVSYVPATKTVTPETERRDLARHRFAPPLQRALGRRVRRGGRLAAHPGRAGHQHDAPLARRPHRRQQRLGERDGAQDAGGEHLSATAPCRSPRPCRRRRSPRCAPARTVRPRLLRLPWPPRRSTRCPSGRAARRSAGRRLRPPLSPRAAAACVVGCAHGRDHAPPLAIQPHRRGEPQSAGRAGDDDRARLSHSCSRSHRRLDPAAAGRHGAGRSAPRSPRSTRCRPSTGPGRPPSRNSLAGHTLSLLDTATGRRPRWPHPLALMTAEPARRRRSRTR